MSERGKIKARESKRERESERDKKQLKTENARSR